jgi:hypothetical protein
VVKESARANRRDRRKAGPPVTGNKRTPLAPTPAPPKVVAQELSSSERRVTRRRCAAIEAFYQLDQRGIACVA